MTTATTTRGLTLRGHGVYRFPNGMEVIAVESGEGTFHLYARALGVGEGSPRLVATAEGIFNPCGGLEAPSYMVEELTDTGETYV